MYTVNEIDILVVSLFCLERSVKDEFIGKGNTYRLREGFDRISD